MHHLGNCHLPILMCCCCVTQWKPTPPPPAYYSLSTCGWVYISDRLIFQLHNDIMPPKGKRYLWWYRFILTPTPNHEACPTALAAHLALYRRAISPVICRSSGRYDTSLHHNAASLDCLTAHIEHTCFSPILSKRNAYLVHILLVNCYCNIGFCNTDIAMCKWAQISHNVLCSVVWTARVSVSFHKSRYLIIAYSHYLYIWTVVMVTNVNWYYSFWFTVSS